MHGSLKIALERDGNPKLYLVGRRNQLVRLN